MKLPPKPRIQYTKGSGMSRENGDFTVVIRALPIPAHPPNHSSPNLLSGRRKIRLRIRNKLIDGTDG
jgi:hypothetical protein